LKEVKTRQLKYFGHIKRHDSLLKNLLEGVEQKANAQEEDSVTFGRITLNDGLETA
jgi:hypothetical protein